MDNNKNGEHIDLISLPKKSFWKLSIPLSIFIILNNIFSLVDILWISQLNMEATFALGASGPLLMILNTVGDSIGQGTNSTMSRFIGSNKYESSYNALMYGLLITIFIGIIFLLLTFFMKNLIYLMQIDENVDIILAYVSPQFCCAIVFLLCNVLCETFQSEGNSKTPVKIMIFTNILNLILDPIFIFTFNMGISGAAYATIVSTLISVLFFIYLYLTGKTKIPLSLKYFKPNLHIIFEIFKVSIPNTLEDNLAFILQATIVSTIFLTVGQVGLVLYAVSIRIREFLRAPIRGMGRGLMSVSGHLFGAKKIEELEKMYIYVLKMSFIVSVILSISIFFLRDLIYASFQIINMETPIFYIVLCGIVLIMIYPIYYISAKILDGMGKSYYSLAYNIVRIVVEAGLILLLKEVFHNGACVLVGIMIGEIVYSSLYIITFKILFKRYKEHEDELVTT